MLLWYGLFDPKAVCDAGSMSRLGKVTAHYVSTSRISPYVNYGETWDRELVPGVEYPASGSDPFGQGSAPSMGCS